MPTTTGDAVAARSDAPFRALPSVSSLCGRARAAGSTLTDQGLSAFVATALERERAAITAGARLSRADVEARVVAATLALERPRLAPLLNATGVII
ncbi:MAG TPA: hypothetical protein VFX03_06375, partial [Thermomicrobiales bacterium]|nr:hypothetical protein [Thermomicrobiales bacterium]